MIALRVVLFARKLDEIRGVVEIVRPVAVGLHHRALAVARAKHLQPLLGNRAKAEGASRFPGVLFDGVERLAKIAGADGKNEAGYLAGIGGQHDQHAGYDGINGAEIRAPLKHGAERVVAAAKRLNTQIRAQLRGVLQRYF